MRASHVIVVILGFIVSFTMVVFFRSFIEVVGADASDTPYTGLWIYTPYASDRIDAKIFLQGGDGVQAKSVVATIDGAVATMEEPRMHERPPGRRYDMGKLEIELAVVVPEHLASGDHVLAFDVETTCEGSSFSHACGRVHLEAPIDPGSAPLRLWALVRAIGAATIVWLVVRYGKRPVLAWVNEAGKSGGMLGVAFIPLGVLWGYSSYWFFARPLGAGLGTSSDLLYTPAILVWLALLPFALVWRRKQDRLGESAVRGIIRFVPEPPAPGSGEVGYRDAAVNDDPPEARTLDHVVRVLQSRGGARLRRAKNRIVPALFFGAPVTLEAEEPDDVLRGAV
jgi:hypothetical protein